MKNKNHFFALTCLFLLLHPAAGLFAQREIAPEAFIYHIAGADTMKGYVFRPVANGKEQPAILLFHGGAWRLGDASWTFQRAREFAAKGVVAICID